jgi:hypothetical protein
MTRSDAIESEPRERRIKAGGGGRKVSLANQSASEREFYDEDEASVDHHSGDFTSDRNQHWDNCSALANRDGTGTGGPMAAICAPLTYCAIKKSVSAMGSVKVDLHAGNRSQDLRTLERYKSRRSETPREGPSRRSFGLARQDRRTGSTGIFK